MIGPLKALLFTMTFCFSFLAYAENHMVYFGGGFSSYKPDVMFDKSLVSVLSYAKAKNVKADFFYRKDIPASLPAEDKAKIQQFTAKSYKEKIRELARSISSGKIKPGEQLLVYLDTHGKIQDDKYILGADDEDVDGETIQHLIRTAEKKGVKLGIIGATCYSGSLMKYSTPNTCIVTAAQPDRLGFYGDVPDLSKTVPFSSDLETLFLESRADHPYNNSQPMISTEAGVRVDEMLSPLKSNIIHEIDRNKLPPKLVCTSQESYLSNLEKEVRALKVNTRDPDELTDTGVQQMRELIKTHNALQTKLEAFNKAKYKLACINHPFMEETQINMGKRSCANLEQIEWVAENYYKPGDNRQTRKGLATANKKPADRIYSFYIEQQETEDYKNYQRLKKENKKDIAELTNYSRQIASYERSIYTRAYKKASKESKAPNPCKDFKL